MTGAAIRIIFAQPERDAAGQEIKHRSNVVGIFPNREAVIRLVSAVLMEQQDEWEIGRRYFSIDSMQKTLEGFKEGPILMAFQT